jgi:hypothetical protein
MEYLENFILQHFPDIMITLSFAFISLVAYGMIMS